MENSQTSGNFCVLMSSMKDSTKSAGTRAAFLLWASLKFNTKTPASFDGARPCTDLYMLLVKTTDSANILTHTKSTDKLRKAVAWPLTGERVFPQVSFTPKAIGQ